MPELEVFTCVGHVVDIYTRLEIKGLFCHASLACMRLSKSQERDDGIVFSTGNLILVFHHFLLNPFSLTKTIWM